MANSSNSPDPETTVLADVVLIYELPKFPAPEMCSYAVEGHLETLSEFVEKELAAVSEIECRFGEFEYADRTITVKGRLVVAWQIVVPLIQFFLAERTP